MSVSPLRGFVTLAHVIPWLTPWATDLLPLRGLLVPNRTASGKNLTQGGRRNKFWSMLASRRLLLFNMCEIKTVPGRRIPKNLHG